MVSNYSKNEFPARQPLHNTYFGFVHLNAYWSEQLANVAKCGTQTKLGIVLYSLR
jgi:hypothetical protein